MANTTLITGSTLILLGIGGYAATGAASITALIPAFFGLPIAILGILARKDVLRKHVMHAAAALGLLGFLGTVPGILKLGQLISGEAERPMAIASQTAMAIICAVFCALCIKSFVAARRAQRI